MLFSEKMKTFIIKKKLKKKIWNFLNEFHYQRSTQGF